LAGIFGGKYLRGKWDIDIGGKYLGEDIGEGGNRKTMERSDGEKK
jgi:hypothetical protein